ncbi:MAG: hypothetical protein JO069_17020 [Verrucomicrobia bacterium]|nr:hypothetical protein [Verrucomicrobiota bacterium]
MSNKLTALKENYCRPANMVEKADKDLFPIERNSDQGRTMIARAPRKSLPYLEFDPSGLKQTYREETTGAELPVFAVFNLEGTNQLHAYIGAKRKTSYGAALNLANHLPFARTQKYLEVVNQRNLKAHRIAGFCYLVLAVVAAIAAAFVNGPRLFSDPAFSFPQQVSDAIFQVLVPCGATFFATLLLGFLVTAAIVNKLYPPKTLSLTATFDGILPPETRAKALRAKGHFDNLYLVMDQQHRWESELLPVPASVLLDPLLIGEKRERFRSRYFLVDQFELTKAEDYLVAEFSGGPAA